MRPNFAAFSQAGQKLARLHPEYEQLKEWKLKWIETPDVPLSYRVEKMKLAKDKKSLRVNDSLTLAEIPPETFDYRLGNRSALEWVIDQHQVSEDPRSGTNLTRTGTATLSTSSASSDRSCERGNGRDRQEPAEGLWRVAVVIRRISLAFPLQVAGAWRQKNPPPADQRCHTPRI